MTSAMPRRPRLCLPGTALHLIQRGNNRSACFFAEDDYLFYLHHLEELARRFDCAVHAYVLMTNHVHLLLTPAAAEGASVLMKHLSQRYVQYINRSYRRSGTLWEGRFRSCLTQSERYVLACYRYIELNPVRAGMVQHPADYRWSSYRANALGSMEALVAPHEQYLRLGADEAGRLAAYRSLVAETLDPSLTGEIRRATNGNVGLGNQRFQQQIEQTLGRRAAPASPGRPRKGENPFVKG